MIFCLHTVWKAILQKGSFNLMLLRCFWLLPLQEYTFKIWKIRIWFCVHSFTLTRCLWLQCLYMSQIQQRRATAKHPHPSCSCVVNDSHLISSFLLHTHPAHLMCTSPSQDLSLQLFLQWFTPIWKKKLLLCLACYWLPAASQLTWSSQAFILHVILLSTYSKKSISYNWKIEPLPTVGSLFSQDRFCM